MKPAPYCICPKCHVPLRGPTALCNPCGTPGNGTVRFADGVVGKLNV